MVNKVLALTVYCLRWPGWAFHYLLVWPAAMLVLLSTLVLWLDGTTPGRVAVEYLQEAGNITDGQHWKWKECAASEEHPASLPAPHGDVLQEACPQVVSDAQGYAAHIDRILWGSLVWVWVVMALTSGGLAWLLGHRPYFPRYIFVKTTSDRGYIRCARAHPPRGMGAFFVSSVEKVPEKHQGCDVYASSLNYLPDTTFDKPSENEGGKQ